MMFVMDERVKHRLTGLVVVLSIAAIFIPAMMKKTNHHFEPSVRLAIKLPPKPTAPKVVIVDEKTLFKSVKRVEAHLTPAVVPPKPLISRAESLNTKTVLPKVPAMPQPVHLSKTSPVKPSTKKVVQRSVKKERFAVQLASFLKQENAKSLVSKLQNKGYKASYAKFNGKEGAYYKVIVGQLNQMDEAHQLQKKLAESTQLKGFVVKTGVS